MLLIASSKTSRFSTRQESDYLLLTCMPPKIQSWADLIAQIPQKYPEKYSPSVFYPFYSKSAATWRLPPRHCIALFCHLEI